MLAGPEQTLGQWSAGAVASLDRPDPLGPGLRVGPYRGVAGLVGAEPAAAEQPPPGRTATTWLGLDDPAPTATSVAKWLTTQTVSYALSGDVAADLLAPWARPNRALVYVDRALDLTPLGLTPASPDAATLELVVPDDAYVLRDARLLRADLVVAHPWRVWADTLAGGNIDAADALRTHLLGVRTT